MTTLLASIPSPPSNGLSIGPLDLRAYGLMIALGVITAVWMMGRRLEQRGFGNADDASSIGMWGVTAGVIGARLYHVATDWHRFSDNLTAIPKIWEGGLGIPGGLLAGLVVGIWQGNRRGIPTSVLLTCSAPAIPVAQAIGRLGNWFNQELFGRATDLPWALRIDDEYLPAGYAPGTTFHPTFLYECLWNLGLAGILLWVDRKHPLGTGRLMALYVMGYGLGRYWIEGLRIDPATDVGGLRWNQWVALAAIVGGGAVLLATRGERWRHTAVPADGPSTDRVGDAGAAGDDAEPVFVDDDIGGLRMDDEYDARADDPLDIVSHDTETPDTDTPGTDAPDGD
ncbi:MAG: prolipoprotein diacylglyceryl transferase [Ilumatobacteraceae bacterium]